MEEAREQGIRWEIGNEAELDSFAVQGAFVTELEFNCVET